MDSDTMRWMSEAQANNMKATGLAQQLLSLQQSITPLRHEINEYRRREQELREQLTFAENQIRQLVLLRQQSQQEARDATELLELPLDVIASRHAAFGAHYKVFDDSLNEWIYLAESWREFGWMVYSEEKALTQDRATSLLADAQQRVTSKTNKYGQLTPAPQPTAEPVPADPPSAAPNKIDVSTVTADWLLRRSTPI